jgi:hypothetical protein
MKPQAQSASIVMTGAFNPVVFHPSWFALNNLLSRRDAETAEVRLIVPQMAAFTAGGLQVEVRKERFAASADEPQDQIRVRDLIQGVFGVLAETPVTQLELLWAYTFALETEAQRRAVSQRLAPTDLWATALGGPPSLVALTMRGALSAGLRGQLDVTLEPIQPPSYGIKVEVHHVIHGSKQEATMTADGFVELMLERWDDAREASSRIATEVLGRARGNP